MKVLLINSNQYKLPVPPMAYGLCLVAATLETAGHQVKVLDLSFSKNTARDITQTVNRFQPGIVGVSVRNLDTGCENKTLFLLDQVKKNVIEPLQKIFAGPVVIGGSAVGIAGREILGYFDLEYAIIGDGEHAMREFVERIEKGKSLHGLRGLTWRKDNKIIEENPPWYVEDIDTLPQGVLHRYLDLGKFKKHRVPYLIQSKRGCAQKCSHCIYKFIEGTGYRLRDPQKVADEIEKIYRETGCDYFEFTDSTFNIPLDHSKAVLRAIIAKTLPGTGFHTMGLNPAAIDEEYAQLLVEANFTDLEVGIESCSDKVLASLGKNYKKEDIVRTAEILRATGKPIMWYLMYGAPGETRETIMETAQTLQQIADPWDLISIMQGIRVYKNSQLSQILRQSDPNCTQDNFLRPVFFQPDSISIEAIKILNKIISCDHPNWIFPADVQRVPGIAMKALAFFTRHLVPHQPWWRSIILLYRIQKALGIYYIRKKFYERKNKNQ